MKKAFSGVWAGLLILMHILVLVLIYRNMPNFLDSDMSSEMVLGKLLAEENRPVTDSWYYSTEIRVLNTQLLYAFFFRFTQSWKAVRMLATVVLHLLLTGSVYYFGYRAGYRKQAFLMASVALFPLSIHYFYAMLMGCYYVPHIVISFMTMGFCMGFMKNGRKHFLIVSGILAFLAGLGGIRQIVILYFPLLVAMILLDGETIFKQGWKQFQGKGLLFSIVMILSCGVGYLVNVKVLSERYLFKQWNEIHYTTFSIERVSEVLHDILVSLGYQSGAVNLKNTICNGICLLLLLLLGMSVIHGIQSQGNRKLITVFFLCNMTVFLLLYCMTDMDYTARYNIPIMVFAFPLMVMELSNLNVGNAPKWTPKTAFVLAMVMIGISGILKFQEVKSIQRCSTLPAVAEFFKGEDYHNGYATFWNANVLTELTNGKVEVYAWKTSLDDGTGMESTASVNDLFRWLQKTQHFTEKPSGKVFILLTRDEFRYCRFNASLVGEDLIYASDDYLVYGYENYEVMQEHLQKSVT